MCNNIMEHIKMLDNEYDLTSLHYTYTILTWMTLLSKESFYWSVIIFNDQLLKLSKEDADVQKIKKAIIMITIMISFIPLEDYLGYYRTLYIKKLKDSSSHFFFNKLNEMNKYELLTLNLLTYENNVEHLNENIEYYIYNTELLVSIPLRMISITIMAYTKELHGLLVGCAIYVIILETINKTKLKKEMSFIDKQIYYENKIKSFVTSSKNQLVNNEFNMDIINKLITKNTDQFKNNICLN